MIKITLKINDQDKIFTRDFVSARMLRRTTEVGQIMQEQGPVDPLGTFDTAASYLVELYNNQFTADDVLDGIESSEFQRTVLDQMNQVTGRVIAAVGTGDPNE